MGYNKCKNFNFSLISFLSGTDELVGCPRELDKYNVNAGSLLFLPDLPGVDIYTFTMDQSTETQELNQLDVERNLVEEQAELIQDYPEEDEIQEASRKTIHSITGQLNVLQW